MDGCKREERKEEGVRGDRQPSWGGDNLRCLEEEERYLRYRNRLKERGSMGEKMFHLLKARDNQKAVLGDDVAVELTRLLSSAFGKQMASASEVLLFSASWASFSRSAGPSGVGVMKGCTLMS